MTPRDDTKFPVIEQRKISSRFAGWLWNTIAKGGVVEP
jgi:hypothetical protein